MNIYKLHSNPEQLDMWNKPYFIEGNYGRKEWLMNGTLHREDGPAIEYTN